MPGRQSASHYIAAGWQLLIGRPLPHSALVEEQITPVEGLSALSLDALTSVAYGPEAIIVVLAVAGAGALHLVLPITVAIVVAPGHPGLLLPPGDRRLPGRRRRLRRVSEPTSAPTVSLVAAAALIVDYTLTVAVSIAAGVGALTSAFPACHSATVPICLGILALVTVLNLRGLGETARAFLLPTLVFIVGLLGDHRRRARSTPWRRNVPQPGHSTAAHPRTPSGDVSCWC